MTTSVRDSRPRPSPHPPAGTGVTPHPAVPPSRRAGTGILRGLGRDLALVLPGMFLSVLGIAVLLPLAVLGIATAVIWVGVVILPLALVIAGWFAELSRTRTRRWGMAVAPPRYRTTSPGLRGWIRITTEGRRWADLAFESVLALPVRVLTFTVTVTWLAVALGGLTWGLWIRYVPGERNVGAAWVLGHLPDSWVSPTFASSAAGELLWMALVGLFCLVTLPAVARAMAALEAVTTVMALSGDPLEELPGARTVPVTQTGAAR